MVDEIENAVPTAVKMELPDTDVQVNETTDDAIERYFKFIVILGQGAFGEVWEAKVLKPLQTPSGRTLTPGTRVAVKIQNMRGKDFADVAVEINALRKVSEEDCPSIGKVYDVFYDTHKEKLYFIMQLIRGADLQKYRNIKTSVFQKMYDSLDQGQNPSAIISEDKLMEMIIFPVTDALECLHKQNIAHRDIKLQNIMIDMTQPQRAVLVDFGLSCISVCDGNTVGTPKTMAPETMTDSMDTKDVDAWMKADLWSLGCALYELVTNKMYPLQSEVTRLVMDFGDDPDLMEQLIADNSGEPDLSGVNDAFPKIKELLGGLLQMDPDDRTVLV